MKGEGERERGGRGGKGGERGRGKGEKGEGKEGRDEHEVLRRCTNFSLDEGKG